MRKNIREIDQCIRKNCRKITWEDDKGITHEIHNIALRQKILDRKSGFKINEVVCSSCRDKLAREDEEREREKMNKLRAGATVCGEEW